MKKLLTTHIPSQELTQADPGLTDTASVPCQTNPRCLPVKLNSQNVQVFSTKCSDSARQAKPWRASPGVRMRSFFSVLYMLGKHGKNVLEKGQTHSFSAVDTDQASHQIKQ